VTPLRFEAARRCVIDRVSDHRRPPEIERVPLECAAGRILAEDVHADRSYPPFTRSIRDGFAVRAAEFNGQARVIGEVRAGEFFMGETGRGEAVEIMTGAPLPSGTDAVIMVEHVERRGETIATTRQVESGDFISARGSECSAGERILTAGSPVDFAAIGVLATVGIRDIAVYRRPHVSIVATGDELVPIEEEPASYQIRNSNSYSLSAQVARTGGSAAIMPVARDTYSATREVIEGALQSRLLLLSGGVSAGKYDVVENVLSDLGAEFYFDRALIQPGQPVVFGRVGSTFFFGLPGNPASTMVTFEIFAKAAIELIGGATEAPLRILYGRLAQAFRHKPGLTRFFPARRAANEPIVTPVKYHGSGDIFALGRANCFLMARDDREFWEAGDLIEVLPW
jgi:molybdopterin molybdotransferase